MTAARRRPIAVLVMAYGTPARRDDVRSFYTDIRRGRPPSAEQLADLERRYDAIGGLSPLAARSAAQVEGIAAALETMAPGEFRVAYGAKHGTPSIEDAVARLAETHRGLVGVVLAPHYSPASVGEYVARADAAARAHALPAVFIERYGADAALVSVLARRVADAMATIPDAAPEVVFTAHSLPVRLAGDGYGAELAETAARVAQLAGLARYTTGYQSAGRTNDEWLGPDVLDIIDELASAGARGVVVCPAGFTSEHLEILYDLDIEARGRAERAGLAFARTVAVGDDPAFCAMLARLVRLAAGQFGVAT